MKDVKARVWKWNTMLQTILCSIWLHFCQRLWRFSARIFVDWFICSKLFRLLHIEWLLRIAKIQKFLKINVIAILRDSQNRTFFRHCSNLNRIPIFRLRSYLLLSLSFVEKISCCKTVCSFERFPCTSSFFYVILNVKTPVLGTKISKCASVAQSSFNHLWTAFPPQLCNRSTQAVLLLVPHKALNNGL